MNLLLTITILAWLGAAGCSLHYLRLAGLARKARRRPDTSAECQPVSIVMAVHNQESALAACLPVILAQNYEAAFEVIVVDMNSDDNTLKLLERLEEENVHLHHTFCPGTARDISLSRLALTLGFRSACYEWVLILAPDVCPLSPDWLSGMAQSFTRDVDAVQGFAYYNHPHGWSGIRQHFFRLWQQTLWMPWNVRFAPYRADDSCLAYRKSLFMSHQGFASSFSLRYGAATLLVNHNVRRKRMGLALATEARLAESQPDTQSWRNRQLFYMETRRHMRHACPYRLWYAMCLYGNFMWLPLAAFTIAHFHPHVYITLGLAAMWLVSVLTACASWHHMARVLGVRSYALLLPLLLPLVPWWDLSAWLRWRFESRKTFRKKFV